jgi:hypothetical protein
MVFSTVHIMLTSVTVAVLAFAVAALRLPRPAWQQATVIAVLAGAAVFLWRMSANMPQLNDDGLPGFSANDWAAPILTYVVLAGFADLRPAADPGVYRQVCALVAVVAVAVNVITI